jgi:hypothetical protein
MMAEADQLAVHPAIPQPGYSPASRSTSSRGSRPTAGRSGRFA